MTDIATVAARAERFLCNSAELASCDLTVEDRASLPWASATFSGSRHTFTVSMAASHYAEDWLAEIPVLDMNLHGQLLADAQVVCLKNSGARISATIELLLVRT